MSYSQIPKARNEIFNRFHLFPAERRYQHPSAFEKTKMRFNERRVHSRTTEMPHLASETESPSKIDKIRANDANRQILCRPVISTSPPKRNDAQQKARFSSNYLESQSTYRRHLVYYPQLESYSSSSVFVYFLC